MDFVEFPGFDPSRHLSGEEIDQRLAALPAAPPDRGTVSYLVARGPRSERWVPERCRLTVRGGLPGDRWAAAPDPDAQLAVQQTDVATCIANGQPLSLFGDNLTLDLDLSAGNLPVGARLRVGEAVLLVTPKPHRGCAKYAERFGPAALRYIASPDRRARQLRGLYLRVVEEGDVAVGDAVEVLSR